MSAHFDRRSFLKTATAAAVTALALPHVVRSAEKRKLRVAIVGVGGRGGHGLGMAKNEEVVALCDVDTGKMGRAQKTFPNAGVYQDYRELFEKPDDYDAVIVSTPDHHHYPAVTRAIRAGKAVYCEKPLTWSVWESLQLAAEAEKHKVPTQMGNQGMGSHGWRIAYDYVKAGAIGEVREVHTWTGVHGGWFTDGIRTPEGEDPVPETLNWDKWLGPAPVRPYKKGVYHPAR
ncbi:MAG: Gfo/Idh/MocA family oxidoreductase, partial [Planctomycetota bacterium]|nr:Gfo/Idh/MocA family oxidoreductase [Planctomycetota bacterium]